jgi:hypothetical protein
MKWFSREMPSTGAAFYREFNVSGVPEPRMFMARRLRRTGVTTLLSTGTTGSLGGQALPVRQTRAAISRNGSSRPAANGYAIAARARTPRVCRVAIRKPDSDFVRVPIA